VKRWHGNSVLRAALVLVAFVPLLAVAAAGAEEWRAAMQSTPDLHHGAELFRNCAVCHGTNGSGTRDGDVPRIAGQHFSVLARQLVDYRHDRRWDFRMEHFADRHHLTNAHAIADVAEYIHDLNVDWPPGQGDGQLLVRGQSLYRDSCMSCHGGRGEGDSKGAIPRVAGQHYEYLLRQIYNAVDGRRPNFSPRHIRLLAKLERDDIVAVADYMSRLDSSFVPPEQSPPPEPVSTGASP
jgi:cytochrome c553